MVHCKANEKYMELSKENRLGINETILKQFRDAERADVIRIMELARVHWGQSLMSQILVH